MSLRLAVFNPSNYWRGGHVTLPWQPIQKQTGIPPEKVVVRDEMGIRLPCQVDRIDPNDSSCDTLTFSLMRDIGPGPDNYSYPSALVTVEQGDPIIIGPPELRMETYPGTRGIKLFNKRLEVWFNLLPGLDGDFINPWYSGSASMVLLDNREVLDATCVDSCGMDHWMNHDRDKRTMQVDHIQLMRPGWEATPDQQVAMYNTRYEIVSQSVGQVRATFTIKSLPFSYQFVDPATHKQQNITCNLYRVVHLYAGGQYMMEDMYVKGTLDGASKPETLSLHFAPRYLAHLALGHCMQVFRFAHAPSWWAVGSQWWPHPGYGFATDQYVTAFLRQSERHFLWQLNPCQSFRSLHIFMRDQRWVDSWTGDYWYRFIYKPLRAEIHQP